jgi:hypothetical protein
LSRLVVYIISIVAILVIAHCPVLRADEALNSPIFLDFEDIIEGTVYNNFYRME